jgi:hypothetical protein
VIAQKRNFVDIDLTLRRLDRLAEISVGFGRSERRSRWTHRKWRWPSGEDDAVFADYCRDVETYLCRKNDGHLMGRRSVDLWRSGRDGVPLKVASGNDRYWNANTAKGLGGAQLHRLRGAILDV